MILELLIKSCARITSNHETQFAQIKCDLRIILGDKIERCVQAFHFLNPPLVLLLLCIHNHRDYHYVGLSVI